jgi:tetratricopeptide (TPR) repeat protein
MLPSPELASIAYAEVASFVKYLSREKGAPALRLLLVDLKAVHDMNADGALRSVTGYDLSGLNRLWQTDLMNLLPRDPREERERLDPVTNRRALARHVRLGDLLRDRGHSAAALGEYRNALDLAPANAAVRFRAAEQALHLSDPAGAEELLGTLRDVRAPHGGWLALRGRLDREAGREADAAARLEHALGVDPLSSLVACVGGGAPPKDPRRRALCDATGGKAPD